jgi:sugar fermentation stimulation protein A
MEKLIDMSRLTAGRLIQRRNRFVADIEIAGTVTGAHVPNTGRMGELAIPGRTIWCVPSGGKYPWKVHFIEHKGRPVMIDSIYSNRLVGELIRQGMVPGLEDARVVSREPAVEGHRFDFLLDHRGERQFLEVKSCTLAWGATAAFPDAVSSRASEHAALLGKTGGILLFFIHHGGVKRFIPNYHQDWEFYRTVKSVAHRVQLLAVSADYSIDQTVPLLTPVAVEIPEVEPRGIYCVVLYNDDVRTVAVGGLGTITCPPGYYIYFGSGGTQIFRRVDHHRMMRKRHHWHIDYLRSVMKFVTAIPVVGVAGPECRFRREIEPFWGEAVPGFGSSDCSCGSHLLYGSGNPLEDDRFWDVVCRLRFGEAGTNQMATPARR